MDSTDAGRNSVSSLMNSGLPTIGFLEIVGDGDGGSLSSSVAAEGVPYPSFSTRAKTAETSLTAGRSGLGVRSVVVSET